MNTPVKGIGLSAAEAFFGRRLRDLMPYLDKSEHVFANP